MFCFILSFIFMWSIFLHVTQAKPKNVSEIDYQLIDPFESYMYRVRFDLNFESSESKERNVMKSATNIINKRYPAEKWLRVYTDGSVLYPQQGLGGHAGAGVYSKLFSCYVLVGNSVQNFEAEVTGVWIALKQLLHRIDEIQKVVILIDSTATIVAIGANTTADYCRVYECRKIIRQLEMLDKEIVLQWIPSHSSIRGNEVAHSLARKATKDLEKQTKYAIGNWTNLEMPVNNLRFLVAINKSDLIVATKWNVSVVPVKTPWFVLSTKLATVNISVTRHNRQYKLHIKKKKLTHL